MAVPNLPYRPNPAIAGSQFGAHPQDDSPNSDIPSALHRESAAAHQHIQDCFPPMGGLLGKLFRERDASA